MTTKKVRIIGIDPGFDRLGIAILDKDGDKEVLIHSMCIITSKKENFAERIVQAGNELAQVLAEYAPEHLAIEKLFFTKNQLTAMMVAEMRGVIIYLSKKHGLDIFEYSPPEIKVAVTGYGKATKEDVASMVQKIVKMEKKERLDDEMDAIAIALTHSAHHKMTLWK